MPISACPDPELLSGLLSASLTADAASSVRTHVAECPACRAALERATEDAELARWALLARAPSPYKDEEALERLMSRLEETSDGVSQPAARHRAATALGSPRVKGDLGTIGPYRIIREIGRGGLGVVFEGYDDTLGRSVAIKRLHPERVDADNCRRLAREARLASRFRHDHVVVVYAVEETADGVPFIVMEYVPGPSVADRLREQKRLVPRVAAELAAQAATGLAAAHDAGLIHCDVKPANLLFDPATGRVRIVDFGLAHFADSPSSIADGTVIGTPSYMSPEQARGQGRVDALTDQYSLGASLYEMLTGEPPFRGTPARVVHQVLEEEPVSPRQLNEAIPRDLETICAKAMAKEPSRRYPTSGEFADDLWRWLRGETIRARSVGRLERAWRFCRRRPLIAGLTAALVLVVITGFASTFSQWRRAERQRDLALKERALAESNFRPAREAVDTYLTQVSENDVLKAQNLEPLRRELLQTAREFYERFVQQNPGDHALLAELGRAHKRLGLITSIVESKPKALDDYQKARAIFERLHQDDPDDPLYQRELAESWFREGECLRTGSALPELAEAAYRQAGVLQESLVKAHPEDAGYQADLARTLRYLGNLYLFRISNYDRALETLLSAREIFDGLPPAVARAPAVQFEHSAALLTLAKVYAHTDRPAPHRAAAETAGTRFDALVRAHAGNPDYLYGFVDSLTELGDACRNLAQVDMAQKTWQKARVAAEELARAHPANGYYRHLVADITSSLASLAYHERHHPNIARPLLQKALEIEEEVYLSFPTVVEYGFYLGIMLRDNRDWFGDVGPLEAYRQRLTTAIRAREHEAKSAPQTNDAERLACYYGHRSIVDRLLGRYGDFADDMRHVVACGGVDYHPLATKALVLAQRGEYTQAESAAADLAASESGNGGYLYWAAQISAIIIRLTGNDRSVAAATKKELRERLGKRAVDWIRESQSRKHFSNPPNRWLLDDDRDLDPLRERADFQALVATQNGGTPSGK